MRQNNQLAESTVDLSKKDWILGYKKYPEQMLTSILKVFEN